MIIHRTVFLHVLLLATCSLIAQIPEGEIAITASSTLPDSRTAGFTPDNLNDGTAASWCEGVDGSGRNEYMVVDFRYPDDMRFIVLKNGYGVGKYWKANARIRSLKITDRAGDYRVIELEDTPRLRTYGLTELNINEQGIVVQGDPLSGDHFIFEILDVYEGERWEDACITEIMFNQWHTANFSMDDDYVYNHLYADFLDGWFGSDGTLYVESEWKGWVPFTHHAGHYYEEIVSGDGTTGYRDYLACIDHNQRRYYMLAGTFIHTPDQDTQEGRNLESGSGYISTFFLEVCRYDLVSGTFESMTPEKAAELFELFDLTDFSFDVHGGLTSTKVRMEFDSTGKIRLMDIMDQESGSKKGYIWERSGFRSLDQ